MITLHAYILRELLRSFALTLAATTTLFMLGGGLFSVVRYEGLSGADLLRLMPLLLPMTLTITVPLSALFAATLLFGRLAADNELNACRAAGVNVHRLFLAVWLLALLATLYTLMSSAYLLPGLSMQFESYLRSNIRAFAYSALRTKGYVRVPQKNGMILVTAEDVRDVSPEALQAAGFDPPNAQRGYLWIARPRLIEIAKDTALRRYAAARGGLIQFEFGDGVRVTGYLNDTQLIETGVRTVGLRDQKVGPYDVNMPLPVKPSTIDLTRVLLWRSEPWRSPEMARRIDGYLQKLRHHLFYEFARGRLAAGGSLKLSDANQVEYAISAAELLADDLLSPPTARDVRIHVASTPPVSYVAPRARVLARSLDDGSSLVELRLEEGDRRPVVETQGTGAAAVRREKRELILDRLHIPPQVERQLAEVTYAQVLDRDAPLPGNALLDDARESLRRDAADLARKCLGQIHWRIGFSASFLATIGMGAVLGVVFRGSRALAAVGLAAVPFLSALLLTQMGKKLTEQAATTEVGPAVVWMGLGVFLAATLGLLFVGVRR